MSRKFKDTRTECDQDNSMAKVDIRSESKFFEMNEYQSDNHINENPNRKRKSHIHNDSFKHKQMCYDHDKGTNQGGQNKDTKESDIKESVVYYEKILQNLRQELSSESKDMFAVNALQESQGKEVELSCHGTTSHCLEMLLTVCRDVSVMQRFMSAFAEQKVSVCTSANASHITEILICYAVKAIQNWSADMDSEDCKEGTLISFCFNWLSDFGEFVLQNLNDCLSNTYSSHVVCTLVRAFAGDLSQPAGFRSKNSKAHKEKFRSQYFETESTKQEENPVVLEHIPKFFAKILKQLYKSVLASDVLLDIVRDSSSATVIEALLFALKRRLPKSCKKMIVKFAEILFSERNQDNVPLSLMHKNCSFVVDEVFKAAEDDSQLTIWNSYIVDCLGKLVAHPVGNFVVQRMFDVVSSKTVFEAVSESIWCYFDDILMSQNFSVFVSIATACNRLSAQQAPFMKHIMKCLQCNEPEERQNSVLPLLLGFQKYENYVPSQDASLNKFRICLQGSLVAQAVLKFHKPIKVVQSIINMTPTDIEFLAGHIQSCHVLNVFFASKSVGEKNKEKLLLHLKPVLVSIACDRHKSLTLSRIWVLLSMKSKEVIARELAQNKDTLVNTPSGYAVFKKFGIHHFRRIEDWREIQTNASYNKNSGKY